MQTRVKFCGLTSSHDVQCAVELGVDALGFVFVSKSARYINPQQAYELINQVPPFIVKVGLFMNEEPAQVKAVTDAVQLNLLQFHGEEDRAYCDQFNIPYLKAVPMASITSLHDYCDDFPNATGFLLDSHAAGTMGGSGKSFIWDDLSGETLTKLKKPVILAGGLSADNVAEAIRVVRPYAVDVSSGIETSKGVKDPAKMQQFIKEVRSVRNHG